MAPTVKRSPSTGGMEPEADSGPQNSITVAGAAPAPASNSSDTSSARTTPAEMANSVDDGARPASAGQQSNPDRENGTAVSSMTAAASRSSAYDYEFSDIDEITMRQLNEDILAYNYDLDYCRAQLEEADLTPQETRTLQLRTLDLGHQIRHCKHRIQTLKFQTRGKQPLHRPGYGAPPAANHGNGTKAQHGGINGGSSAGLVPVKRTSGAALPAFTPAKRPLHDSDPDPSSKRIKTATSPDPDFMHFGEDGSGGVNTSLQRLGFWKCRLCSAPKYLLAGAGRSPAAPCKWPLKDISKMITHFTEMHAEHSPSERCAELGAALSQNRGPFEYWLRRTRAQNISDGSVIDDCLATLLEGEMPHLLRRHSRAAAGMATY